MEEGINTSTGFSYLKRDLVRLLGVLCHGVKSVQDRVREAGGLPVVMNMCVIDERNPCQPNLSFGHWSAPNPRLLTRSSRTRHLHYV